ncbi:MAG: DNA polymerase III subunit delta, partial [Candidatus Enteromonas sp.]|nr:DNA polymerase III subunit delta [Candidatus Enteromonas sp.]
LFRNEYAILKKQAETLSYSGVEEKIDAITRAKTRLDVNANFDVTMELLLLTLKDSQQGK